MNPIVYLCLFFSLVQCGNYSHIKNPVQKNNPTNQPLLFDKSKIDFALIQSEILKPHCISCHKGTHKIYDSYLNVRNSSEKILGRIKSFDPSTRMPPQKEGFSPLNPQLILLFEAWIELGRPEFIENTPTQPARPIEQIGFEKIKEKVLKPYNCTSCHTHFNDYVTVQSKLGSIVSQITNNEMPFPKRKNQTADPVSEEDKNLLLKWVQIGAPEFSNQPSLPIPNIKRKPTWISLRNQVFGPKCILCHNSFGPRGPKSLGSYREIREWFMKNPNLFNFDMPDSSDFMSSIYGTDPESFGTTMPYNNSFDDINKTIPELTVEELTQIKEWIKLKLPYDEEDL